MKSTEMIGRLLQKEIEKRLFKGKAIIIFGARQTGKSTLVETLLGNREHMYLNGDDADVREIQKFQLIQRQPI